MSIIKDNILYHNAEDIVSTPLGYKLYRYPVSVCAHLNSRARLMARYNCGCEMRFVTESELTNINIYAESGSSYALAVIFRGDYVHDVVKLDCGRMNTITLNKPKQAEADCFYKNNNFDSNVWRIHFHNCEVTVCSVDTMNYNIRPPKKSEMPSKTMLAYGSSITHGARSVTHTNSYAEEAARILGTDIMNKGVGGSCRFESESADFLAKNNEWDFAWIEGAVNSTDMTPEEFDSRFTYFTETLAKTGRQIFMTTIFPTQSKFNKNNPYYDKICSFDEIIRSKKNIGTVIEGSSILTDLRFLTTDFIHPSNEGHTRMGINMADILQSFIY